MSCCNLFVIKDNNDWEVNYEKRIRCQQDYKKIFLKKVSFIKQIPEEDLEITKGINGKSFFQNHNDIHFNISYTSGVWTFAISSKEVGVDIERIRDCKEEIIKRFYSQEEQTYVNQIKELRNQRFYEVWTKKEAYTKFTGQGVKNHMRKKNMINSMYQKFSRTYVIDGIVITLFTMADSVDLRIEGDYISG